MLVPSSYRQMPAEQGCYNNQIVMGGSLTQIASALTQLSHVKFLGEAHYQFSHGTYSPLWGAEQFGARLSTGTRVETSYKTYEYNLLYQSTAITERLALMMVYGADQQAGSVSIKAELRDTAGNSYTGAVLDYGIEFTAPADLRSLVVPGGQAVPPDEWAFTGCRSAEVLNPLVTDPLDRPRPLVIPSANRGELLNIKITVNSLSLVAVHIYDVYQLQVTI